MYSTKQIIANQCHLDHGALKKQMNPLCLGFFSSFDAPWSLESLGTRTESLENLPLNIFTQAAQMLNTITVLWTIMLLPIALQV